MYNEMDPRSGDLSYLTQCNAAVYQAMVNADASATYVMQAWLFHSGFWTPQRVQAYLAGVPVGSMLILDLNSEESPVWQEYDGFYGHAWVWNSLFVYGGRRGLYGNISVPATRPFTDRAASPTCVGIGFTPEAIDQNLAHFDLTLETAWRSQPVDGESWLQSWALRRYGKASPHMASAYNTLFHAAYQYDIDTASLEETPGVLDGSYHNTNATGILSALRDMLAAGVKDEVAAGSTYSYDLLDLTRQVRWR